MHHKLYGLSDLRHPFTQGRYGDLAAYDDERDDGIHTRELDEDDECRGDHELVGQRGYDHVLASVAATRSVLDVARH